LDWTGESGNSAWIAPVLLSCLVDGQAERPNWRAAMLGAPNVLPPSYLCTSLPKRRTGQNKMNIREIAERAGVSAATVSRVINCIPTVDRKLAKRVWNVVGDLGYSPNGQARGLVSGKSRVLGLA